MINKELRCKTNWLIFFNFFRSKKSQLYVNVQGKIISIDIREKTCKRFGFEHGQKIWVPRKGLSVMLGVTTKPNSVTKTTGLCYMVYDELDVCILLDVTSMNDLDLTKKGFIVDSQNHTLKSAINKFDPIY